jgi:hypothetical protein
MPEINNKPYEEDYLYDPDRYPKEIGDIERGGKSLLYDLDRPAGFDTGNKDQPGKGEGDDPRYQEKDFEIMLDYRHPERPDQDGGKDHQEAGDYNKFGHHSELPPGVYNDNT